MTVRLGADIGGTFTDIVLEVGERRYATKILTDHAAPEQAILDGIDIVLAEAGLAPSALDIVIHGTTLATNALIERRGARTAFITTEGFRDVIEMRSESRFDQYDLNLTLPKSLIPRVDRFAISGRIGAQGQELLALDEAALKALATRSSRWTTPVPRIRGFTRRTIPNPTAPGSRRVCRGAMQAPLPCSGLAGGLSNGAIQMMRLLNEVEL